MDKGKRTGTIDFWKFICSIVIVAFHARNFTKNPDRPFINGAIMVEFFFLVSGYLMAASLLKYEKRKQAGETIPIGKTTFSYILHKIAGMCPEYYVAMVIGFWVNHVSGRSGKLVKDLLFSIWDVCFLSMGGMTGYHANAATWYISAMLLAMLVLVPICLKNRDLFLYVIAPVVGIFSMGVLYQNNGYLAGPERWQGFYMKGLLRALGELCLGAFSYILVQKLKEIRLTVFGKVCLTVVEFGGFGMVLTASYFLPRGKTDFLLVVFLFFAVSVSFSHQSIVAPIFDNKMIYFLGKFSFSIFLGHIYWSHAIKKMFPHYSVPLKYLVYAVLTLITAMIIYGISQMIRKSAPTWKNWCKSLFIQE